MRTLSGLGTLPIVAFFWVGKMGPTPLDHLDRPWRCWATMSTCPPFSKKQIWIRTVQNQDVELGGNQEEPMLLRKHGKDVGFCPLNVQPVCSKKAPWCFERFCAICHLVLTFLDVRNIPKSIWATSFISKVLGSFRFNRGILNSRTVLVTSIYCTIATKTPTAP